MESSYGTRSARIARPVVLVTDLGFVNLLGTLDAPFALQARHGAAGCPATLALGISHC